MEKGLTDVSEAYPITCPPTKHSYCKALQTLFLSKLQLVPEKLISLHFTSWFPLNALYTKFLYVFSFRENCWGS